MRLYLRNERATRQLRKSDVGPAWVAREPGRMTSLRTHFATALWGVALLTCPGLATAQETNPSEPEYEHTDGASESYADEIVHEQPDPDLAELNYERFSAEDRDVLCTADPVFCEESNIGGRATWWPTHLRVIGEHRKIGPDRLNIADQWSLWIVLRWDA